MATRGLVDGEFRTAVRVQNEAHAASAIRTRSQTAHATRPYGRPELQSGSRRQPDLRVKRRPQGSIHYDCVVARVGCHQLAPRGIARPPVARPVPPHRRRAKAAWRSAMRSEPGYRGQLRAYARCGVAADAKQTPRCRGYLRRFAFIRFSRSAASRRRPGTERARPGMARSSAGNIRMCCHPK